MTKPDPHGDHPGASFVGGVGSVDLATDSTDPGELRGLLLRARERLSFYEGFDRLIAENVCRSGELMLETLTMREEATADPRSDNQEELDVLASRLDDLDSGLDTVRAHIESLSSQLSDLRASVVETPGAPSQSGTFPIDAPNASDSVAPAPRSSKADVWPTPQVIDMIAHRVTKAATALSLQRYLGDLGIVVGVEAREFAEGVLRMQVTARQPIDEDDLTGWTECGPVTILQLQPNVIEIDLKPGSTPN